MGSNLFESAIKKNELLKFSLGQGEYFLQDREYDEHWVLGSWINFIEPLYLRDKNLCNQGLLQMFQELINETSNIDFIIEKLLYHAYVAYYLTSEKRLEDAKVIIGEVEPGIISKINNYRVQLSSSKKSEIDTSIKMIQNKGGLKGLQLR